MAKKGACLEFARVSAEADSELNLKLPSGESESLAGQVRIITRPKSRTIRAEREKTVQYNY